MHMGSAQQSAETAECLLATYPMTTVNTSIEYAVKDTGIRYVKGTF